MATDGGVVKIFDNSNFAQIGEITVQQNDITVLVYVRTDILVVGQVQGCIDVVLFVGNNARVTHSV